MSAADKRETSGGKTAGRRALPRLRRRFGLRTRITMGVLGLSVALWFVLGSIAQVMLRQSQLDRAESQAWRSASRNAEVVLDRLVNGEADAQVDDVIDGLSRGSATVLLAIKNKRYVGGDEIGFVDLPPSLEAQVDAGNPAAQRFWNKDVPWLAVGTPIRPAGATYYEAISLADVEQNLQSFLAVRLGAMLLTVLAGLLAGRWVARRAVAPLVDIRLAAEAIARDQFDTRLPLTSDPDLNGIVSSFNNMAEALQRRIERDARFASDVSHELRSPLMTVAASVEVLQRRRDELPERAVSALDLLSADIERFQALVADLLEISRFDAGAQHLDLSPVAITAFLEGTCHELSRDGRAIRFVPQPGLDDLLIMVDRRRLLQVVVNTSTNAAKYADGLSAITLDSVPGGVEIGLEDDGPGVIAEERQLIFERFARGASAGNRGSDSGTGLGLALVSEHVGLHGGRIWVEDARHSTTGARFVCFFPSPPMSLLDEDEGDDEFVEMAAGVVT